MKILVIGKNGYVSKSFQCYMQRYPDILIEAISVRDDSWKNESFSKYDVVFNTIGLAHDDARKGTVEQFMALNRDLPKELALKSKKDGVKTFIYMSSMIVYGDMSKLGDEEYITDKTLPNPSSIYGESKLAGEIELNKLRDENFNVAIIRSPLIYSANAVDNFLNLKNYAKYGLIFPNISNKRSMIYSDNLCELVKLIAENDGNGLYFPQQETYICTSKLVKDIANKISHPMLLTNVFNPIIFLFSKKFMFIRKVFDSLAYSRDISDCFNGAYRVVSYDESIERLL